MKPEGTEASSLQRKDEWQALLPPGVRERALEAAVVIGEHLRDPERVQAIARVAREQWRFFSWGGASFSCGQGGLALLYLYLARGTGEAQWLDLAHKYLRLGAESTQRVPLNRPGVFDGSSGFALVLSTFQQDEPLYRRTAERVHEQLAELVLEWQLRREKPGMPPSDYDIIGGAAGVLGYLVSLPSSSGKIQDAIQKLLEYLIWLSGEDGQGRKNWLITPEHFRMENELTETPDGYFNVGFAHGIAGPLAALAHAWQAGYRMPDQLAAMRVMSNWIVAHQVQDTWGVNWPSLIPLADSFSPEQWTRLPPTRTAWCYGTPGIAASLRLAGAVLKDHELQQLALATLETTLRRPPDVSKLISPTLCHGFAGLLAVCLRFAHTSPSQIIRTSLPQLTEHILATCNPALPCGVQDIAAQETPVDDPGFLTGAVGVALTLLAAATYIEPAWDRSLLIA